MGISDSSLSGLRTMDDELDRLKDDQKTIGDSLEDLSSRIHELIEATNVLLRDRMFFAMKDTQAGQFVGDEILIQLSDACIGVFDLTDWVKEISDEWHEKGWEEGSKYVIDRMQEALDGID